MHTTQKPIGLWSAVSMGIGAMVGAGIFALLGQASAIAGSAVYISFIAGGVIALSSAYSLGKLGAAFPSSGGIIEYLTQAYRAGFFTGSMSIMPRLYGARRRRRETRVQRAAMGADAAHQLAGDTKRRRTLSKPG